MISKIKSIFTLLVIFWQKIWDNSYRFFKGVPTLKRSQITANLFLGSQYSLIGLQKLKELGITAIVNMREHADFAESKYDGIHYLHLPTVDNTPPPLEILIKGVNFVTNKIKNGGKVYIHCRQGLGRGPTMTIAYLISTGLNFEDAFALVKKVRTFINPRPGQIQRLKELEQYYKENSRRVSLEKK